MSVNRNVAVKAPEYAIHREGVTQVDNLDTVSGAIGVNMSGYEKAHIQVIPKDGANPNCSVNFWSAAVGASGKFIAPTPALAKTGAGVDVPYEFTVDCQGRKIFVAITGISSGSVDVYVSGFNREFPG